MRLSEIHTNPNNPRLIKDERFKKLCQSIKEFPKMMSLRPIIIDEEGMILGGNMRFKALKELGYKDVPDEWVKRDSELTEDEKQRFIIADNIPFGEYDWDILAHDWDKDELLNWGLEIPDLDKVKKKTEELRDFARSHVLISYHPDQHLEVQKLLEQLNTLENIEIERASN